MFKNFYGWHRKKKEIDNKKSGLYFHEREIWFCSLGVNIGFEQNGKGEEYLRPVLIIKKFNKNSCITLPLSKTKKSGFYYYKFKYKNNEVSTAILSQIKLIDSKRLKYLSGHMKKKDFNNIKKKLRQFFA